MSRAEHPYIAKRKPALKLKSNTLSLKLLIQKQIILFQTYKNSKNMCDLLVHFDSGTSDISILRSDRTDVSKISHCLDEGTFYLKVEGQQIQSVFAQCSDVDSLVISQTSVQQDGCLVRMFSLDKQQVQCDFDLLVILQSDKVVVSRPKKVSEVFTSPKNADSAQASKPLPQPHRKG